MLVTYFQRKPSFGQHSVEVVFEAVKNAILHSVEKKSIISRYNGTNPYKLIYNIIEAVNHQGDINHITGDIHYIAFGLNPRKTILTILDIVSLYRLKGVKHAIFKYLWYDLPIKRCKIITVISEHTAKEVLSVSPHAHGKIKVIHCPVNPSFIATPNSFNSDKPILLQIGTGPNKNLERLAEAISDINCHLEIVGKLSQRQQLMLEKYKVEYSNSYNLSDQEIVSKYQNCDMVAFVSTYEGFGMPIIEANAIGRPVITSNLCSMPEVAGDAACIVDPLDIQSIRNGILKIINDHEYRGELIIKGFENTKRFQASTIANEYLTLYKEIFDANQIH